MADVRSRAWGRPVSFMISTCDGNLGKTWRQCNRHAVYPDGRCHLHTKHLDGTHVQRSREDARRQVQTNTRLALAETTPAMIVEFEGEKT